MAEDGTVVMGLPGCVMYAGATIFDLVLPKIAAGVEVTTGPLGTGFASGIGMAVAAKYTAAQPTGCKKADCQTGTTST